MLRLGGRIRTLCVRVRATFLAPRRATSLPPFEAKVSVVSESHMPVGYHLLGSLGSYAIEPVHTASGVGSFPITSKSPEMRNAQRPIAVPDVNWTVFYGRRKSKSPERNPVRNSTLFRIRPRNYTLPPVQKRSVADQCHTLMTCWDLRP